MSEEAEVQAAPAETPKKELVKIKKGDYTVQVHIIEARDLKGRDSTAMSDPVVYLECLGAKRTSSIKKQTLNCMWDEVFYFAAKDVDPDRLESEKLRVFVKDANTVRRNVLIGAYEFDLSMVYYKKHHELHRCWVALTDVTGKYEGVQGYLRLSIVCLGPDDEQKMHDGDDDDDDSTVLMPPSIEQKGYLLSAKCFRADNLVQMDEGLLGDKADPYVRIDFASLKIKGTVKKGLSADFNEVLQLPVWEPTMSDIIRLRLMDRDVAQRDDIIGQQNLSYSSLRQDGFSLRWIHFYGSPALVDNKVADRMNKGSIEGSHFRGSLLYNMSIEESKDPQKGVSATGRPLDAPKLINWLLQVDLYEAIEVPKKGKWKVEVCCGPSVFASKELEEKNGVIKWYSSIVDDKSLNLSVLQPEDPTQCPDVFIYLVRKKQRVSYYRIPFPTIVEEGWMAPPRWITLKEDKALDKLSDGEFPGSVLMGIRCGPASSMPDEISAMARPFDALRHTIHRETLDSADTEVKQAPDVSDYGTLTLTIVQGKDLPIADKTSSDPFVKVRVGKVSHKTRVIKKNLNPVWNETFKFKDVSIYDTVSFQFLDHDTFRADKIGTLDVKIGQLSKLERGFDFETDAWYFITEATPNSKVHLKVSFQYMSMAEVRRNKPKLLSRKGVLSIADKMAVAAKGGPSLKANELEGFFGEPRLGQYQIRVHLYEARQLIAMDANGSSDPYIVIHCAGLSATTPVRKETLNPRYYQTHTMIVELPQPLEFAPAIHLYILDKDMIGKDEVLGRFQISVLDAMATSDEVVPVWYPLTDVDGHDIEGEVLASFQVLPIEKSETPLPVLKPEAVQMYLEISTLGLRCVQSTFGVFKPRIEFELPDGKKFMTNESRRPSSTNPNFLQVLRIPVMVPLDPRFAPSLAIEVRDILFGGYVKRRIGSAHLLLEKYMTTLNADQWEDEASVDVLDEKQLDDRVEELEERIEMEDDVHLEDDNEDQEVSVKHVQSKRANSSNGYAQLQEEEPSAFLALDMEDGPVSEEEEAEDKPLLGNADKLGDAYIVKWGEKVSAASEDIPSYLKGRKVVDDELEDTMSLKPFDEIIIKTGKRDPKKPNNGLRNVATFKGLVRMLPDKTAPGGLDVKDLMAPKDVYVRLYVLRGRNLTPMDSDGASDPYLVVKLGKKKYNMRSKYIKNTLNPEFYQMFEFPCQIPGASELTVEVWDFDGIGDDLIGVTTIDVEDRWFTKGWREIKKKPLEWRTLQNPSSSVSQGKLECWLDMYPASMIKHYPAIDISPPPKEEFELRVIMWECKDVTIKDTVTNQNDLYITGRLDHPKLKRQRTDTHLRSKKGKGSFNWRMKFPVTLPMKEARFSIQIWDMDFFSSNDSICEAYLSLSSLFRKAYKVKDRTVMIKDGKDKFWIKNLRHPNEPGKSQGKVCVSIEVMPVSVVEQLPAGFGRSEPNMNPVLPPPTGRMSWNLFKPWRILKDLLGSRLYYKLCCLICCCLLLFALVFVSPMIFSNLATRLLVGD